MAKAPEVAVTAPTPQPLLATPSVRHCEPNDVAECTAACEKHDALSCVFLGETTGSGVSKDDGRAAALFKEACDLGQLRGCIDLGTMYRDGRGVAKDEGRAAVIFQQGCDEGYPRSCFLIGDLYEKGSGVSKDEARALSLYTQACDAGDQRGCASLGQAYAMGTGVKKDEARGFAFSKQACDEGVVFACVSLGSLYARGMGVAKDEAHAVTLFTQTCEGGSAEGCAYLGSMSERGKGVSKNHEKAIALYRQGCQGGSEWGCVHVKRLAPNDHETAAAMPVAQVIKPVAVAPASEESAADQFARLDGAIHRGFAVEAQHRQYVGTPDDIFVRLNPTDFRARKGLYQEDAAEADAHDEALAHFLKTCTSPDWKAAAMARQGMLFDELRTALYEAVPPQVTYFTAEQEALLAKLTSSGAQGLIDQAADLRKSVVDGWQRKKDVELRAADEMMIKRYAAAVASARVDGVINPLVTHAAQRLAYFTDVFGEAKMRELVVATDLRQATELSLNP
jgi:TPR repeat protein